MSLSDGLLHYSSSSFFFFFACNFVCIVRSLLLGHILKRKKIHLRFQFVILFCCCFPAPKPWPFFFCWPHHACFWLSPATFIVSSHFFYHIDFSIMDWTRLFDSRHLRERKREYSYSPKLANFVAFAFHPRCLFWNNYIFHKKSGRGQFILFLSLPLISLYGVCVFSFGSKLKSNLSKCFVFLRYAY